MPWVKIDEHLPDHRKLASIEGKWQPLCGWLFVTGLCYCNRQLTDGFIPVSHVPRLIDPTLIRENLQGEDGDGILVAEMLVAAGLWEYADEGYRVHDYHDYQPSKEEALALRAERSAAGKAGATARWHGKDGKPIANRMANGMANRCPVTGTGTVTETETETSTYVPVPAPVARLVKLADASPKPTDPDKYLAWVQAQSQG